MNMKPVRYLLRSLTVLNLLMAAAAIGFFIAFLDPLLVTPVSLKVPMPNEISSGLQEGVDETKKPSTGDYTLIGEQNLFHPDRAISEAKKSPAPATLTRPELILHGTMLTGELKIAYLEDKKAASKATGRGASHMVIKEGENVSGYILKQITENMIVLANGEEQMTLYLDELKDRKGEITGPTSAPVAKTPPQMAPRPSKPQPLPRSPTLQSVPSAPSRFSGRPNVQQVPPRPSNPVLPSQTRRGLP